MKIRFLNSDALGYVREKINSDQEFQIAARFMNENVLLEVDKTQCILKIRDGLVNDIMINPGPMESWSFVIRAPENAWEKLLKPFPPPFYQGFFSASMREDFQFAGNLEALFAHYWPTQRLLTILREFQNEGEK